MIVLLDTDVLIDEDALQVAAAAACGADVIATRNTRDYAKSPIRASLPGAVLQQLRAANDS